MDFIFIANAWNAGKDNPTSKHWIAVELIRKGNRVLWIEGSGMRTPRVGSSADRLRMVRKVLAAFRGARREEVASGLIPFLHVLSPLFIPLPRYESIRRLNGLICRLCMRFWTWRLGLHDPVLINYVPVLAEAMRVPRAVYHCVDRWDAFSNYDSEMMAAMDRRCCELAELVIASSRDLLERCRRYNANVHLVSHGVDHDHFSQALHVTRRPADLPPGRVVGFFGLLSEWLDQDLLVEVARRVPECEVVLIGKADVPIEKLKGIRNLHLLGPRPFSQLPEYLAFFEVGLIPFVINELTLAVNPIKLKEMLSAGCPVVSTDLPEVRGYPGVGVDVANTKEGFVENVIRRMQQPVTPKERIAISAGVAKETWSEKVKDILVLITENRKGSCPN